MSGSASALIAQGGAAASSRQVASAQANAANHAGFTKSLVRYLRGRGFHVNPGYPMLYPKDASSCPKYTYPATEDCFGNNPTAPYVMPVLKSWPNEYVNPATRKLFGPVRPGYSWTYRLSPREAVVIYGDMPPPGKYMSLQTFEFSQHGHWKAKDYNKWLHDASRPLPMQYLFNTIPPNDRKSQRVITTSALGNNINNVVMQRRSGYAFGKKRYFIITPSATADRAVRVALHAQGISDRYIFTEQIPSWEKYGPIGPLGMGKNAIDFNTVFRYAVPNPDYADAAKQWRSHPPLTMLRVRVPASLGPVRRYGALTFEKRTAHSEAYLAGDLQNLVGAVCSRASTTLHLQSTDCAVPPPPSSSVLELAHDLGWIGPYCRGIGMDCNVDNVDTTFYVTRPLALDSGQVYAVIGTLATQTRNATYVALSVNDLSVLAGVHNILDTTLKGSADSYAGTVKNTDKFFVQYYTRNCAALADLPGAQNCTDITPQMVPPRGDSTAPGHPALKGTFMLTLRDYIVPGTERGPDPSKLLHPRILEFSKP